MNETFDFGDGNGPVPAHQHRYHGGGWVANTARVSASASVSSESVVFGSAQVLDNAVLYGYCRVSGTALVPTKYALDSAILEKPEDIRTGVGWIAFRIATGVEISAHQATHLLTAHVRSWSELPKKLHQCGLLSTEEYLATVLMEQEP